MSSVVVHGRATSSNVQKVMWTLAELGVPHGRTDVGGAHGGLDTPAFRAISPHGKIPAVELGDGRTMFESNAIVRHFALADPERRLWPETGQAALDADAWAEWAHNNLAFAVIALFWAVVRTRPADRDPDEVARWTAASVTALDVLEQRLADHRYVAGSNLSIADIVAGHLLFRWFTMEVARPTHPAVEAYYARLSARPAYATHVMVDYAGLRPT